jgi:hypothetical protein
MPHVTLRLEVDQVTRRRTIVVSYTSDPDALPQEHEEEHRAVVKKLLAGGLITEEEAGRVRVERQEGSGAQATEGTAEEQTARRALEEKG